MTMPPERLVHILADTNCYYCKGDGMESDYEGYPMPMPVYWWPCRCVEKKWTNAVEYFTRPKSLPFHRLFHGIDIDAEPVGENEIPF